MPKRPYKRYEDLSCFEFSEYLRDNKIDFIRICSEIPTRNFAVLARMRKEGWESGIPDYFITQPTKSAPGLFIEMKHDDGNFPVQTGKDKQHTILLSLARQGYICYVCKGAQAAIEAVEKYFKGTYQHLFVTDNRTQRTKEIGRCYNLIT